MNYRKLLPLEISTLTSQGCSSENWQNIEVDAEFNPALISSCRFEGVVRIGKNVSIKNICDSIANYYIGDNVIINNVESIIVSGESTFGNGTSVAILNENGGREVKIFDSLTAQIAYIIAMYKHRPKVIKAINDLIDIYVHKNKSPMGSIGKGTKITNCGAIINLKIGEYATLNGALELSNGTVGSNHIAPTTIGRGVIARDFITTSSAEISDAAIIEKCFVGQGCIIGKGFSAENSLFFANSVCYNGEACSIFAGPYTVSHHRASLLIGGMFSFYNAGSGSNQSNHYYRLGAVHQGILERGVKTTSSSYILFPARIGAFSIVKGRHNSNIDTANLPFSYVLEDKDQTVIVPAANFTSVGVARDAMKWRQRDTRKGDNILDLVNFKMLNPYTIGKILTAINTLQSLSSISSGKEYVPYGDTKIACSSIKKAINTYQCAINKYTGSILAAKLQHSTWISIQDIAQFIDMGSRSNYDQWVDIAGMIAPISVINQVLNNIENKNYCSIEEISDALLHVHKNFREFEWVYVVRLMATNLNKNTNSLSVKDIIEILKHWKTSVEQIDIMLYQDAKKEFSPKTKISYGIDGDNDIKESDFKAVRGEFEENSFVKGLSEHSLRKGITADMLIERLQKL